MLYFYSIAMATISNTSSITTSEDSQNNSETDFKQYRRWNINRY